MPLLRIRTRIDDRPGRLAVLTAALARRGANILDLSVQVDTDGVVDEFVVDVPPGGADADELRRALEAAGGVGTAVVTARPNELVDEPTRVLLLGARLRAEPHTLPAALAELLRADAAAWVSSGAVQDGDGALTVPVGGRGAVRLRRAGLPFTATEAARADALVRAVLTTAAPRALRRVITLRDGTGIVVRPLVPDDAEAVRAMHGRCSLDSRRMRYFSPKPHPSRAAIARFCEPAHGLALVAEVPDGSLLALAHLIHVVDPSVAELAFLVEDAWQGRGVGRALAGLLVELGRERGLVELRATALSENARMRRLLTSLGGRTRRTGEPGIVEIRLRLDGRAAGTAGAGRSANR
ncbi:GNAT family N-acetyltransferase [Spirillospora sp. CA-294931]|uniref:GNAT family N-acetyltransferase n=1 Tax=Spirillospora sp. CA-294931 TaxID=3240042 RepID=UPI003D8AD39B